MGGVKRENGGQVPEHGTAVLPVATALPPPRPALPPGYSPAHSVYNSTGSHPPPLAHPPPPATTTDLPSPAHWDPSLTFFDAAAVSHPATDPAAAGLPRTTPDLSTWFNLDMLIPLDNPSGEHDLHGEAPTPDDLTSSSLAMTLHASPSPSLPSDIAAIYASLNDDFLRSLPKPARELISQHWHSLASTTELGRAASMALCMLQFLRLPENRNPEAKQRILRQSNDYFERAISHLADGALSLEAQLNAVVDMHYHQLDVAGAAAAYAVSLMGELFVQQSLGERPTVDFARLVGPQSSALRLFAYSDVARSFSLGGRRTLFQFRDTAAGTTPPGVPAPDPAARAEALRMNEYLGLPVQLLICLADVSNLAVDKRTMPPAEVEKQARAIEEAIERWQATPEVAPSKDSVSRVQHISTQEMVRPSALLLLLVVLAADPDLLSLGHLCSQWRHVSPIPSFASLHDPCSPPASPTDRPAAPLPIRPPPRLPLPQSPTLTRPDHRPRQPHDHPSHRVRLRHHRHPRLVVRHPSRTLVPRGNDSYHGAGPERVLERVEGVWEVEGV